MDQSPDEASTSHSSVNNRLLALTVAAVGVVYGDIGTSPLYSVKECFSDHYGLTPGEVEIKGILSLIFWALTLIIAVKYLAIIIRFDNEGEGGILALMGLVTKHKNTFFKKGAIIFMGLFGSALLYGDGVITPAISVLSAIEGITVAAPSNELGFTHTVATHNQLRLYGEDHGCMVTSVDADGKMAEVGLHKNMLITKIDGKDITGEQDIQKIVSSAHGDDLTFTVKTPSGEEQTKIVHTPSSNPLVLPITLAILFGLFFIQRFGTASVGRIFGPFMIFWFALLGGIGLYWITVRADILTAINPYYAVMFFSEHGMMAFAILGSVFLVVTGGEALYADMGHFGRSPITRGWFFVAYPGLILQYFGQGALLLERGHEAAVQANPFFNMVPTWGVIPLVIVATCATIIASQAVISGAFSLTWQAIQLDYLPRFKVMHTSSEDRGQIYIPIINWLLFAACVMLVVMFKTSGSLAAAYGIAVTSTMVITTILAWFAIRNILGWNTWVAGAVCSAFLIIDGSFLAANALKFPDGGWVPVAMAALIFMVMITWNTGHRLLGAAIARRGRPLVDVLREENRWIETVAGSSVYMTRDLVNAPQALITNLRMNRVRHETIILVWINVEKQARLVHKRDAEKPFVVKSFEEINAHTVEIKYGFMEQVNLERDLKLFPMQGVPVDVTDAVFVLGHENVSVQSNKGMALWRKKLFVFLHRNSRMPAGYFGIADKHTLEIGAKVTI